MSFCCRPAKIGTRGRKRMPHSEVCLHMRVADRYLDFEVIDGGSGYPMVQLYALPERGEQRFSRLFSMPITLGEAGIYRNGETGPYPPEADCYYYPHEYQDDSPHSDPLAEISGGVVFETFCVVTIRRTPEEVRAAA